MPTLIVYGLLALALMGAIGTGVYKVKQWGGNEARAELQPKLDACQADVAKQNAAVEALAAEGARKTAEGAKALAKADARAKVWTDNAVRLQTVLANRKPTDAQDCKSAWEAIRKP